MTKKEIRKAVVEGTLLYAGTISAERLEDPNLDVLALGLHVSMEALGWECIKCPHESFQWVGIELEETKDGSLNIYVKINREPKENPEYDEREESNENA